MRGESSQGKQEDVPGIPKKAKSRLSVSPSVERPARCQRIPLGPYNTSMVTVKKDRMFSVGLRENSVDNVLFVQS